MTLLEQKIEFILEKLSPHGLSITGAKDLARLEGVVKLLEEGSLPPNPLERPPTIKPNNGKIDTKLISYHYRKTAADYLNYWIQSISPAPPSIDANHSWPTYQALILYCESKVQPGMKVTA